MFGAVSVCRMVNIYIMVPICGAGGFAFLSFRSSEVVDVLRSTRTYLVDLICRTMYVQF